MIPEETIDKIRQTGRENLLEIVESYVPNLKKKGNSYWGKSPFKPQERTPSFHVIPSRGMYKCFATGKGGDAIRFIQEVEGKQFIEAIRFLGEMYEIPVEGDGRPDDTNKSIFDVNNLVHDLFIASRNKNVDVLKYLNVERGLSPNEIEILEIGFCPDKLFPYPDQLTPDKKELYIKAGILALSSNDNLYYPMRGRLTIPIRDYWGNICGFTCRALSPDQKPKYLNTPETKVYKKGLLLQGLYHAKSIKTGPVHLVEGPFDRIPFIRAGKRSAAVCGTGFTPKQAKLIKRVSSEVNNCFDGDSAGQKAMFRALPIQLGVGLNIHVMQIERDKDPEEMGDASMFQYLQWYRHVALVYQKIVAPKIRAVFVDRAREMIMAIKDDSYRHEVIVHLSQLTGISMELLQSRAAPVSDNHVEEVNNSLEYKWIQYMMNYPQARQANWETLSSEKTFDDTRLEVLKLYMFPQEGHPHYMESDILESDKLAPLYAEMFVDPPEFDAAKIRKTTIALRIKHVEFYIKDGLARKAPPEQIQILQEEKSYLLSQLRQ